MRKFNIALFCFVCLEGCGGRPDPKPKGPPLLQPAITSWGFDSNLARVASSADLILRYAEKHEKMFPIAKDGLDLQKLLRGEFGGEPGFEETWVSHDGKTPLFYSQKLAGKPISTVSMREFLIMIWDPVVFPGRGHAVAFGNGEVKEKTTEELGEILKR